MHFAAALRLLAAVLAGVLLGPAVAAGLTPEEEAGRRIYFEGIGEPNRPIQALVGAAGTPVSGETLPCANCHGDDATGRPEGSVKPSNITWQELTKPYGHRHEDGREHGPFTDQSFADALTYGTDPAGNRFDSSMPRYVMANADIARLLAYVKRIGADLDPGVSAHAVRIGTMLPREGRLAELGQAMRGILQGQVEALNAQGGIFNRKLELVVADYPDDAAAARAAAEKMAREQNVFALVAPFSTGIERELSALAESARLPVIGPFTPYPDRGEAINRHTFHLLAGLGEQARALAEFAAKDLKLRKAVAAVIHPDTPVHAQLAEAIAEEVKAEGWPAPLRSAYPPGRMAAGKIVAELQQRGVQVLFYLGGDADLEVLGKQVRDAIWSPYLLAPGTSVGRAAVNLPTTFGERVFLAYPTLPADLTPKAADALSEMQKKHQLSSRHQPAQLSAYAAMLVLEEGMKRAGRELSRAKFVRALENLFSFETGVMPSISYGPNRRIGALGAHIVAVDLNAHRFRPTGRYIRLD